MYGSKELAKEKKGLPLPRKLKRNDAVKAELADGNQLPFLQVLSQLQLIKRV